MNDKTFGKINFKILISTWQCAPVPTFRYFGELQILAPNLPKKNASDKSFGKINIKFEMRI